jgi:PAS domain S-box-containing protein
VKEDGTYYDVNRQGEMRKLPDSGPPGTQAAMMVPVRHEGRVVGVVQLMSDHVTYDAEQLAVVEGLVAQMAAAVRNARLQKEQRRLAAAEAAARAAAAEREQAAAVLDAVGDGIFLVDREGIIRFWNRAAELLTGVRAERARDRPVDEGFGDWSSIGERIPTAAVGGAPARPVTLPVAVGGRELWLSFVAVRATAGIVYAFRDVTGEHRLEEAKDDFIATISHELRTPMAAVYGASLTLLREDVELEPARQRELVQMIATQSAAPGTTFVVELPTA